MITYYGRSVLINQVRHRHTLSNLFQPIVLIPHEKKKPGKTEIKVKKYEEFTSKSSRLMVDYGIIHQDSPGTFHLLPLGLRSHNKLCKLIDEDLEKFGCQKVSLPNLTVGKLWKKSGRWDSMGQELIKLKDRHSKDFILSPTHEESITNLISSIPVSYKDLPIKLYQITNKFRDEMKPRFGLIRAKEFTMKDLYTFDKDVTSARRTYEQISECYDNIFNKIGVPFVRVAGDPGNIGGHESHEFHFPADIGQDELVYCAKCGEGTNVEVSGEVKHREGCTGEGESRRGIEVGHTFLLGDKYSKVFNAKFTGETGSGVLQMGCYGIGISRVMAAAVEVMSTETEIRWPEAIAPFRVCIITPKKGSLEEASAPLFEQVYEGLEKVFPGDVIHDDRDRMTVGKRIREARKTGYPYLVLFGKKSVQADPILELHILSQDKILELTPHQLIQFFNGTQWAIRPPETAHCVEPKCIALHI